MFKERETFFPEDEEEFESDSQQLYFSTGGSATDSFISSNGNPCRKITMRKKTSISSLPSSSGEDDNTNPGGCSPNSNCCGPTANINSSSEYGIGCDKKLNNSSTSSSGFSYTSLSPKSNCSSGNHHNPHHHGINCCSGGINNNNNNMICYGCGKTIFARYYVFAMDHHFHNECLKCQVCHSVLSEEPTCFERDGRILCKQDYYRLYHSNPNRHPRRCARCTNSISPKDLVMRACELVYHVECFVCTVCQRVLNRGDQFRMQSTDLYCSLHYEMLENFHTASTPSSPFKSDIIPTSNKSISNSNSASPTSKRGRPPKRKLLVGVQDNLKDADGSLEYFHSQGNNVKPPPSIAGLSAMSGMGAEFNQIMDSPINGYGLGSLSHHGGDLGVNMNLGGDGIQGQQQKGKRMRTTFKHNQLRIMKSYFEMNPNPDTKDLKQLSQKTGLCKRVLQVWFQNARAKHRRSCPRSESSMSGGILQIDDSQSQDWSPPQNFGQSQASSGVPIPSHPGNTIIQA